MKIPFKSMKQALKWETFQYFLFFFQVFRVTQTFSSFSFAAEKKSLENFSS